MLDNSLIRELGRICHRLEMVATSLVHPERLEDYSLATGEMAAQLMLAKRKNLIHPTALSFSGIRPDSTDQELVIVLEHFIMRIEHALSSLVLHQLGPFAEVRIASSRPSLDPNSLLLSFSSGTGGTWGRDEERPAVYCQCAL